jgi:diadenosine tetraphosphatase ApaH/serine/threonine PP2A family protein phosphatase
MVEDGKVSGGRQRDGVDVSALLRPGAKFFLNPGSVGQPRDGDPRASYALLDSDRGRVSFHRVGYDIAATQRLMEAVGLPYPLIARLALGM